MMQEELVINSKVFFEGASW